MKKIFVVFGIIGLIVVGAIGALIGFVAYDGSRLDASGKTYVDEAIPKIVTMWSEKELLDRASPELRDVASTDQISQLFKKFAVLGSLINYNGSKGQANMSFTTQNGKLITATYVTTAEFEKGSAEINVRLIQHDGAWQILAFHVNSPLFLK